MGEGGGLFGLSQRLPPSNLEAEQALYERQARLGGELCRIDVAVLDRLGEHRALRPRMAVTQWAVTKP